MTQKEKRFAGSVWVAMVTERLLKGYSTMSDNERIVAEVNENLKRRAKADPRAIRDIVEAALEREFSTGEAAAVERRIDEKEQRIQTLNREINERKRELAEEQEELNRLESMLDDFEGRRYDRLEEAAENLQGVNLEPSNPGIKNWAGKLGMTPHELVNELEELDST